MHAGGPEGYELGNSYRSSQAWRLSNEIRRASSQGRYVIIVSFLLKIFTSHISTRDRDEANVLFLASLAQGGDFNVQSDELPYDILRDHGAVVDAWKESHSDGPDHEGSCSNAREGMEVDGMTVDCESKSSFGFSSLRSRRVETDASYSLCSHPNLSSS